MKTQLEIQHVSLKLKSGFAEFTYNLEKALGILNPAALAAHEGQPASMASFLQANQSEDDLVLFNIFEFDELLKKKSHFRKVRQYQIGNTAMVIRITQRDLSAGLYLPLRLIVYEDQDGKANAEYDSLSTLLASHAELSIKSDALMFDKMLSNLIDVADRRNQNQ